MLQILLAADEKLEKRIVPALEAKGCAVRVVRGLSEVGAACIQEPRPQVIAAALPVSAGGAQAIAEARASAMTRLPPILILLPPNRESEVPSLKAAGAAEVFESPLKLNAFLTKARELAGMAPLAPNPQKTTTTTTSVPFHTTRPQAPQQATKPALTSPRETTRPGAATPAPPLPAVEAPAAPTNKELAAASPVDALLSEELGQAKKAEPAPVSPVSTPSGPPVWPRTVTSLDACQYAIVTFNTTGETREGFEKESLQALFRVMTDVEVRDVRDLAANTDPTGSRLFVRVTAQRLRVRLAMAEADNQIAGGFKGPIDEAALLEWLKQIDALVAEVQPIHEKAVASGDLQGIRQYKLVTDALGRLRRDLENSEHRILGRADTGSPTLIDEAVPVPVDAPVEAKKERETPSIKEIPKAPKGVRVLEMTTVSDALVKREKREKRIAIAIGVGVAALVGVVIWSTGLVDSSSEIIANIPGAQGFEYHTLYTRAIVNADFDPVAWGQDLEKQAKSSRPIKCETPQGDLVATVDGDTVKFGNGREEKIDPTKKPDLGAGAPAGGQPATPPPQPEE